MTFWKIAGFITGVVVVTMIARKYKCTQIFQTDSEVRYTIDDFLSDQEL